MVKNQAKRGTFGFLRGLGVGIGSVATTIALFLMLPVINAIAEGARPDTVLIPVDSAEIPPPDEVVEEEEPEPEEPEPEEPEPELEEPEQNLDLAQLELLMSTDIAGAGGMGSGVDFKLNLNNVTGGGGVEGLFNLADLDGKPTPISQPQPSLSKREKTATPGRVTVIFILDSKGRVTSPKVQSTSNPLLSAAALRTIKKWRFKPGTRKGKPVSSRMRQQFDFSKQD